MKVSDYHNKNKFIEKLYNLLSQKQYNYIMKWNNDVYPKLIYIYIGE